MEFWRRFLKILLATLTLNRFLLQPYLVFPATWDFIIGCSLNHRFHFLATIYKFHDKSFFPAEYVDHCVSDQDRRNMGCCRKKGNDQKVDVETHALQEETTPDIPPEYKVGIWK